MGVLGTVHPVLGTGYYELIGQRLLELISPSLPEVRNVAGVRVFTDLRCWQRSREWSKAIYQQTKNGAFKSDRRLVAQINDSSESVMANIAEGFGRGTQGQFIQFLGYSIGSLNETQSHVTAAYDSEYITKACYGVFQEGTEIRKQIVALITSMVKSGSGVK